MREHIVDESQFVVLHVLNNRVELVLLTDLHLGVRPARDLDNRVECVRRFVGEQWNVVKRADDLVFRVSEVNSVAQRVWLAANLLGDTGHFLAFL